MSLSTHSPDEAPQDHKLSDSPYPGRVIVQGLTPNGKKYVQVYAIMGRSPSSRNRVFVIDNGVVRTAPVDPTIKVDPLTMYNAIRTKDGTHIVTNGDQTDTICNSDTP